MKKISVFAFLTIVIITLSYCNASKKAVKMPPRKLNYSTDVSVALETYCTPCHFPAKGGRKKPLDNYAAVNKNIDDILHRIQLNPTDRGFMPDRKPKLSDSIIHVFQQWKTDGLLEK
ncbi:MAG TPA: hypothetical protein VET23_09695 [Chitinophagaceae bacterium]|nr:hypothetical protein [Chitinophagaceae bacterium]